MLTHDATYGPYGLGHTACKILRGSQLRNGQSMGHAIEAVLQLVCGGQLLDDAARASLAEMAPSDSTVTRARYKLDLAHMFLRRDQWRDRHRNQEKWFVQLCV
jgi:hypothetical protein